MGALRGELVLSGWATLSPLEGEGRSTFDAIVAGERLVGRGVVAEEVLGARVKLVKNRKIQEKLEGGFMGGAGGVEWGAGGVDRAIRMAALVGAEAAAEAGWTEEELGDAGTGLFVGTSKGPVLAVMGAIDCLREWEGEGSSAARPCMGGAGQRPAPQEAGCSSAARPCMEGAGQRPAPQGGADGLSEGTPLPAGLAWQVALGPGGVGVLVAGLLGLRGSVHTSVAACASGVLALHRAAGAVMRGEIERALVVAADASVHPLFEGSFVRLGVMAREEAGRVCEPFGEAGKGFFLTEAAAAVTVERVGRAGLGGKVVLESTWAGGDGTHLIQVDAATETLRRGLAACADGRGVDFVHAHATGTLHDGYELGAIEAVAPGARVFSHKRWVGHSLGAAGLLGVVLSGQCHGAGRTLCGSRVGAGVRSLTVAQGFGGHVGVVGLRGTGGTGGS